MAVSGSGGAYYRGVSMSSSFGLHSAHSIHLWVRATAVPSTANIRTACCLVGGTIPAQNPQESMAWNHTVATFYKSAIHRASGGSYVSAQIAGTPAANTWHSFGCTFDGTNKRVYLNGALEGTSAGSSASAGNPVFLDFMAQLSFAGALDSSSQFDIGQGAELALWNVPLTADEMVSLAKGYRASRIRPASLIRYSPFVRDLNEIKAGATYVKQAGTDVFSDHPPVRG